MSVSLTRPSVFWCSLIETAVVVGVTAYLVTLWYPGFYFDLFKVELKLIIFMLLVGFLGPVINVFIFKEDRDAFVNDMSVIYLVKILVVGIGLHLAYINRPLLMVFSVDRFVIVQEKQVDLGQMPPVIMDLIMNSDGPPLISAREIRGDDLELMMEVMGGGPDIEYRPGNYEKFEYGERAFLKRMCEIDVVDSESNASENCKAVSVPLIYNDDESAVAVFDVRRDEVSDVIFQDPW